MSSGAPARTVSEDGAHAHEYDGLALARTGERNLLCVLTPPDAVTGIHRSAAARPRCIYIYWLNCEHAAICELRRLTLVRSRQYISANDEIQFSAERLEGCC